MNTITIPATYHADLNLHDTQIAIKTVKDFFQQTLSQKLNLLQGRALHGDSQGDRTHHLQCPS